MLYAMNRLRGARIKGGDGEVGEVEDVYFDDESWTVRYFVVDTGHWLSGRQVLLAPEAITHVNLERGVVEVNLTRRQVEESPNVNAHEPVSRHHELQVRAFYGWPVYWPVGAAEARAARGLMTDAEPHLRSGNTVAGYSIRAMDGEIGRIEDFLLDDESWTIRYLIVDVGDWRPGKLAVLAARWIVDIDWSDATADVDLLRDQIASGPEYDPDAPLDRRYETTLYEHYRRAPYWE
jgi:sporulation protein YlmC with PRC-barrel domain